MKKMLILFGVLLVLGAILAACGGQATPTTAPAATQAVTSAPRRRKKLRTARRMTPAHGGR